MTLALRNLKNYSTEQLNLKENQGKKNKQIEVSLTVQSSVLGGCSDSAPIFFYQSYFPFFLAKTQMRVTEEKMQ